MHDNTQAFALQRPTTSDRGAWKTYWKAQGQYWRMEPEINTQRQMYLEECCAIVADIKQGIYPFKGADLSRADVEWLVAMYLNEDGYVDWSDEDGLDLRGANLFKVDLRELPLTGMRCGLSQDEWTSLNEDARKALTEEERAFFTEEDVINDEALPTVVRQRLSALLELAGANLEEADLRSTHLEMAYLAGAHMKRAWFDGSNLKKADLSNADLQWAHFPKANLEEVKLSEANLERAYLQYASLKSAQLDDAYMKQTNLEGAILHSTTLWGTYLEQANLSYAHLQHADFSYAYLEGANLREVDAKGTNFVQACLKQVSFDGAHLEGATLAAVRLEGVRLCHAHLEQANLSKVYLGGGYVSSDNQSPEHKQEKQGNPLSPLILKPADLTGVFFDSTTNLTEVTLGEKQLGFASLADIHWNDVNLAVVDWTRVKMLGDERAAHHHTSDPEHIFMATVFNLEKDRDTKLDAYHKAVRANRQLAVALQAQGLNEDAAKFAYRAQLLQRLVFRRRRKFGQYLFSLFLDLFAGYGYKPWRSFLAYLLVISIFTTIYHQLGPHLAWNEAVVISMTAFHGRGFFPNQFKPGDPQAMFAALEAFVGLIIEVTFIATLTRRFFGQ